MPERVETWTKVPTFKLNALSKIYCNLGVHIEKGPKKLTLTIRFYTNQMCNISNLHIEPLEKYSGVAELYWHRIGIHIKYFNYLLGKALEQMLFKIIKNSWIM